MHCLLTKCSDHFIVPLSRGISPLPAGSPEALLLLPLPRCLVMCLLVSGVLLPESGRQLLPPLGASDRCSSLRVDLLVFLLCSCSAGYILILVLLWSLEPVCTFYPRVLPKAVPVYHFRLFPRAPLNPVHNVIKPFHNNVWPLPWPAQFWRDALLSLGIVKPHQIPTSKGRCDNTHVVPPLHPQTTFLLMCTSKIVNSFHTLSTSQHTQDSLYPQVLLVGAQLGGPRVHAILVQT